MLRFDRARPRAQGGRQGWRAWRIVIAVAIAAPLLGGCSEELTPTDLPDYPAARGYAQLISHPPSGTMVLFGGESNERFSFETAWSFNLSTERWSRFEGELHPTNAGGIAAAYDVESDRIIYMFSTRLDAAAPRGLERLSETWAFDVAGGAWTRMNPDPAPFGLMGARMVYDSRSDRIILFGGADFTRDDAVWFNETWSYDYNSNAWTKLETTGDPPGRSYFGMSYDESADRVLVFGGSPAGAASSMWSLDVQSGVWEQIDYSGDVVADHHPFMVYGAGSGRTFYVVGDSFAAFDFATSTWSALPRDPALGTRYFTTLAFDEPSGKLVLFGGGARGLRYDNETWVFDGDGWSRVD